MPDTSENSNSPTSAYRLVILAAKRAKELQRGAPPRVDTQARKPTTVAIQEVRSGKIDFYDVEREDAATVGAE